MGRRKRRRMVVLHLHLGRVLRCILGAVLLGGVGTLLVWGIPRLVPDGEPGEVAVWQRWLAQQGSRSVWQRTASQEENTEANWLVQLLTRELPLFQPYRAELLCLAEEGQETFLSGEQEESPSEASQETEVPAGQVPVVERTIGYDSGKYGGDGITLNDYSGYAPDPRPLLEEEIPFTLQTGQPQVLLMHTHTTETYLLEEGDTCPEDVSFRSQDSNVNMVAVGKAVAQELQQAGIGVIHDTTVHDYPSYNGSYDNAKATIQKQLEQHPTISVVVDLHRDALLAEDGTVYKTVLEWQGESYAQVMAVLGTDASGLSHPNWRGNLTTAVHLQQQLLQMVPGIARPITVRKERFNQQLTPNSILVEVGTCGNTLEEAVRSGHVVGKALAAVLQE
ncbi:MAG: stage II sporulation protein P [Eubacteriales bacterium]|jgi:stage II sporulation protein P